MAKSGACGGTTPSSRWRSRPTSSPTARATAAGATSIPKQNNFAGLGTTGGGVPGDSYPDVNTGVLAQIQHLVVYSGERIDEPVGARTQAEAGRHPRHHGEQEGSHHLRRSGAPLGRRQALRRLDRMGGEQFPPVSSATAPIRAEEAEPAPPKSGEARRRREEAGAGRQPRRSRRSGQPNPLPRRSARPVRTIWSAADAGHLRRRRARRRARARSGCCIEVRGGGDAGAQAARSAPRPVVTEQIIQTGEDAASRSGSDCGARDVAPETASAAASSRGD